MKAFLALVGIIISFGLVEQVAAASSLTIDQQSSLNRFGRWELVTPSSFVSSRNRSQAMGSQPDGNYKLEVFPPAGAKTKISFKDGGVTFREIDSTIASFSLTGSVSLNIVIDYFYNGTIVVESDPPGANFELKGSTSLRLSGTTPARFENMPPLYYTVSYSPIKDCQLPRQQSRPLEANHTITFVSDFICANELPITPPDDPAPAPSDRMDQINVRVWNAFHQAEAAPGNSVLVTVGVRNTSKSTIHNLTLSQSYNPNQVTMPVVLPRGGRLQNLQIVWDIPQIFAGQSWTATFPVTLHENLKVGEQIQLVAHVSGDEIRSPRGELLSELAIVGIASMPQTGGSTAKNIALLLAVASLMLTFTIRRRSQVVSTV